MRRQTLPPPTEFTLGDKMRLALGALTTVLGIVILWRTLPIAFSAQTFAVSFAFIGFGLYRLWLGYTRWKMWKDRL